MIEYMGEESGVMIGNRFGSWFDAGVCSGGGISSRVL